MPKAPVLLHVLSGLEIGGKERIALRLAERARSEGIDSRLLLFDTPFRGPELDLDPGAVPLHFVLRGPGFDFGFLRQLTRLIRSQQVRWIHAHNETAIVYAAFAARLAAPLRLRGHGPGAPQVCATYHTYPGHDTRAARSLAKLSARFVDHMVAVSEPLLSRLAGAGWIGRARCIWNGVDRNLFQPDGPRSEWRERLGLLPGQQLIGHIGRFDAIKRQEDLVEVAARLGSRSLPPVLVFVGQGAEEARIRGLCEAKAVSNVRFLPRVDDVPSFLRAIDLFTLCSSYEAAPLVLLEAMASGCAIVATEVGGIPAMVDAQGATPCAHLVSANDPEALTAAIARLLDAPEGARLELGRRARDRSAAYCSEIEWKLYRELYGLPATSPR